MGRGPRRGGRKKFTDFRTLAADAQVIQEKKEREARGEEVTWSEGEEEEKKAGAGGSARGKESESDSDSYSYESDSSDSDGQQQRGKKKGNTDLQANNPNFAKKKNMKARDLDMNAEVTLSRREREAIEAQRAKDRYWKLHKEGKTEQARKDLERLALVRKQREEAAKKRAEEKAKKDAKKK